MVIKGPSSALSSFLREKGINVPRYNAYGRAAQDAVIPPTTTTPINVNQTLNPMESTLESLTHNSDLIQIPITSLPTKKQSKKEQQKKRLLSDESDVDLNPMSRSKHTKLTKTNQRLDETDKLKQMLCERCNRKLHHAKQVCLACTSIPQKRRFVKIGLKSENTRYGTKSLFDISMNVISNHIHIIDDFGYLSKMAKQSLSKILSRRRQLTEKNLGLFLGKDEDVLELFDCTLITLHGYKQISTFCPNLKVLDLSLCGRINDEACIEFGRSLPGLKNLKLGGCYLVSEIGFKSLFELDLTVISLSEGEKLNSLVFKSILQKGNLKQLTLKRCPNVCGALLDGLQSSLELKKLKWIKVGNGIKDEYYCNFLEKIGNQLTTLSLSGLTDLGDSVLNSIQVNCTSLEKLTLKNLESVTHEALTHLISHLQVDHLEKLNLHRLVQIKDEIIMILIQRCALKLEVLDINGLDELSEVCLMELSLLSKLRTLDVSFIRNFTDNCMMTLMAKSIQSVRVFGVHKLTDTLLNGVWKNGSGESIRLIGNEFD